MIVNRGAVRAMFLALLVTGCVTKGPDNLNTALVVLPPNSHFWTPPEDRSGCPWTGSYWAVDFPIQRETRGYKRGNKALQFIKINGTNIASSLANDDFEFPGYIDLILEAARSRAYTAQDFEGPGGPSPVFMQSLILISLSYTVALFDHENVWTESERQKVIDWGNVFNGKQDAKRKYNTLDSYAAIAAARMSWGAATSQADIFEKGLSDFHLVSGHMHDSGRYESNPRDNNESIQFMILAAEAAMRNGIPIYEWSYGGLTLHDAVEWHTQDTLENGHKKYTAWPDKTPRSYLRRQGFVTHLAWIPVYLSRFPDHPASPGLRKILASVDRIKAGLNGDSMGGPAECFWGLHR